MSRLREAIKTSKQNTFDYLLENQSNNPEMDFNSFLIQCPSIIENKNAVKLLELSKPLENIKKEPFSALKKFNRKSLKIEVEEFKINSPKEESKKEIEPCTTKDKRIITFSNGTKYEGEFENGMKCGYGEEYYNDGTYYKGEWKNGKKHGKGQFILEDGNMFSGEYDDGGRLFGELEKKDGSKIQFRALKRRTGGRKRYCETEMMV